MLRVTNISKKYGDKFAVDNITFSIKQGEIVGFLGPNGAGKTTMMNIITGYLSPTSGSVLIDNKDILVEPEDAKKNIGYLPDTPPLYKDMFVKEYLNFVCELKGVPKKDFNKTLEYICDLTKIKNVKDRLIKNLSRGYKQRVGLAQALINSPKLIILDEPTNGLDPKQIIEMRDVIKSLSKNHTVILSSHILSEVSAVCSRVIIINEGRLVTTNVTDEIENNFQEGKIFSKILGDKKEIEKALKNNNSIKDFSYKGTSEKNTFNYDIAPSNKTDLRKTIFNICIENGFILLESKSLTYNLEDIFIELTKTSIIKEISEADNNKTELKDITKGGKK